MCVRACMWKYTYLVGRIGYSKYVWRILAT